MTDQGIDETEYQQTLDKPHVTNFQFACQGADNATHEEQGDSQAEQFLMYKLFGTLLIKTPWHKKARDEEIQPHEEGCIGREEMPYPRHEFCRIRWCVSPIATSAVSLAGMVHNHQDGQAYFQIIEIIQSLHIFVTNDYAFKQTRMRRMS